MKFEFKNNLTLKTTKKMSLLELTCSILTWMLVLSFCYIIFRAFNHSPYLNHGLIAWNVLLVATVFCSFVIDIKRKEINLASFLWLGFLIYMTIYIFGKL